MHLPPFHVRLLLAREKRQWRQSTLCLKATIPSSRLSRLEGGTRYPTEDEWRRLSALLDLGPYQPPPPELAAPSTWKATQPLLCWSSEKPLLSRVFAARRTFGPRVDAAIAQVRSREDAEVVEHFLHRSCLDSGHEYFFWLLLLTGGGLPRWFSPLKAGYRARSVVDRSSGRTAGDLRHPCLLYQLTAAKLMLFPQVTLETRRGQFRLDALVCVKVGRTRFWLDLEIDGGGHDPTYDRDRQATLELPTVRLQTADLRRDEFLELFEMHITTLVKTHTSPDCQVSLADLPTKPDSLVLFWRTTARTRRVAS